MSGSQRLQEQVITWAKSQPDQKAIIETETGREITYLQLLSAMIALQNYFGNKSQKILVQLPGGIVDSAIWLASLTGGHLLMPVSPNLSEQEYQEVLTQHQPDLIINQSNLSEIETLIQEQAAVEDQKPLPKEGQVFLSTSGSTGNPKGVILSATQIVMTADNIRKSHQITAKDRGLTSLPFYHVNAPVVSLVTSILAGSTLIIAPKYSTSQFWNWVEKYDPTWISLVPTMIAMLLQTDRPDFLDHSSLRFIRTASEALPAENLKSFEAKFKIPLIETYGLSEVASTVTANPVPPGKHKPGSVGLPLGVTIKICAPGSDKVLVEGEIGEVCLKGENVIEKYENNQSPDSFSNGYFKTGDLGFLDAEGYLHLTGRIKDIIIRGGENISPREIEEVLLTYPGTQEVTVVGQTDPIYGERVVAFMVLRNKGDEKTAEKIKSFAAEKLTPMKVPSQIHLLPDLPRNKTGKIDKVLLRKPSQIG